MFFDCKRKFGLGVGVFRLSDVLFAQEGMEIVVRLGFGGDAQFFAKPVDVGFYRTGGFLGHGGDFFGVYVDGQQGRQVSFAFGEFHAGFGQVLVKIGVGHVEADPELFPGTSVMAEVDGLEHLPDNGLLLGVHVLLEQFGALLFQVLQALVLLGGKKSGGGQVFFFLLDLFWLA